MLNGDTRDSLDQSGLLLVGHGRDGNGCSGDAVSDLVVKSVS